MDSSRFDVLTRSLAANLTRRGLVAWLAPILAMLLPWLESTPTAAKGTCRKPGKRCGGKDGPRCCGQAKCRGGRCQCRGRRKLCRGKCIPKANCCQDADCGGGATCQNGTCNCPAGQKPCNGTCVPDGECCQNGDCGSCETCQGGTCVPGCAAGQECQGGACRCTPASCDGCCQDDACLGGDDPDFCGANGDACIACAQNETCPAGACLCAAPNIVCSGQCVDPETDNQNCGLCGNACAGTATCQNGACAAGGTYAFVREWSVDDPFGVAVDAAGIVDVTDRSANELLQFTASGDPPTSWSTGSGPIGVAVNRGNGVIYVANAVSGTVQSFASDGTPGPLWTTLGEPNGIAVNATSGEVYVAVLSAPDDDGIQRFEADGTLIATWAGAPYTFDEPTGVAVAPNGEVYVANTGSCVIQRFTADGILQNEWGSEGSDPGQFEDPQGVAIDEAGDVYVCDSFNFRIQKFDPLGVPISEFGSQGDGQGTFEFPYGVAVSLAGFLYVTDPGLSLVQQFAPG